MVNITLDEDNLDKTTGGGDVMGAFSNLLGNNGQAEDATAGLITYRPGTTEDKPEEGTGQGGLIRVRFQEQEGTPENGNNTTNGAKQTL